MALSNSSALGPNSLATASRLALGSSAACLSADLGASALLIFSAKARSGAGLVSAARSPLSTATASTKLSDLFSKDGTTARESQGERRTKSLPGGECKTCRVIQSFTCVWGAKRILTVPCRSEVSEPPSPLTPICTPRTGCPCTSSTCTTRKPVSAEAGRHVPKKRRASSARRRGQLIVLPGGLKPGSAYIACFALRKNTPGADLRLPNHPPHGFRPASPHLRYTSFGGGSAKALFLQFRSELDLASADLHLPLPGLVAARGDAVCTLCTASIRPSVLWLAFLTCTRLSERPQ